MSRYHFNVYDGVTSIDKEGTVLPNWRTARIEAVRLAGQLLEAKASKFNLDEDWRMEVTDSLGLILFRLDFTLIESSVISQATWEPQ